MNRYHRFMLGLVLSVPRTRGDEPQQQAINAFNSLCSPHTRG